MSLTSARLKRAAKLTTALADEKVRWEESVEVRGGGRGEGGEEREGRRGEHVPEGRVQGQPVRDQYIISSHTCCGHLSVV